jgi:hypothetical protein
VRACVHMLICVCACVCVCMRLCVRVYVCVRVEMIDRRIGKEELKEGLTCWKQN